MLVVGGWGGVGWDGVCLVCGCLPAVVFHAQLRDGKERQGGAGMEEGREEGEGFTAPDSLLFFTRKGTNFASGPNSLCMPFETPRILFITFKFG